MIMSKTQSNITNAILNELKASGLSPQQGVSAMMSAVLDILAAVAQGTGNPKKKFIQQILAQTFAQV